MTHDIAGEYFDWMYDLVCSDAHFSRRSYRKLLKYLHDRVFTYTIDLDGNRADDGIELRYRFAYECELEYGWDKKMVVEYLEEGPCSVLEMMVALSSRCEEHIMDDSDIGDRTGQWFWDMIRNLDLMSMSDERFNERYVRDVVDIFLNREYEPNGRGGLFTVENRVCDLRTVEIWYQMCWYLEEL